MKLMIAVLVLLAMASPASAIVPLRDSVSLNIGLNCQWRQDCIDGQHKAMKKALGFVRKRSPPVWRIQMCNRNAARGRFRVDWVGFDHCIRNEALRPSPPSAATLPLPPRQKRRPTR